LEVSAMKRIGTGTCLALLLFLGRGHAADAVQSGPQVGEKVPGPFTPLNVTGEDAGKKRCLVCKNGTNPVAMVFARDASDPVVALLKKLDAETAKNSGAKMGSFVVFCSDDEAMEKKLKGLAEKERLDNIILSIDNPSGPQKYAVAKDADVTVVLYTNGEVKANYAFKKGEFKDKDVEKIVGDLAKILPTK
jgi:hypothetical protein